MASCLQHDRKHYCNPCQAVSDPRSRRAVMCVAEIEELMRALYRSLSSCFGHVEHVSLVVVAVA